MISLRFTGGPLDGHTDRTEAPAYEYRVGGGVYRRGRSQHPPSESGEAVIVYRWRVDDRPSRPAPAESVSMW